MGFKLPLMLFNAQSESTMFVPNDNSLPLRCHGRINGSTGSRINSTLAESRPLFAHPEHRWSRLWTSSSRGYQRSPRPSTAGAKATIWDLLDGLNVTTKR